MIRTGPNHSLDAPNHSLVAEPSPVSPSASPISRSPLEPFVEYSASFLNLLDLGLVIAPGLFKRHFRAMSAKRLIRN